MEILPAALAAPQLGLLPNTRRRKIVLADTAYGDLRRAFGSEAEALRMLERFNYGRHLRRTGRITEWPDGEDA